MGRLAGFRYRQIIKRLKTFGFVFDRQAAGSHEIWYNSQTDLYTTVPNHLGDMPEGTLRLLQKSIASLVTKWMAIDVPLKHKGLPGKN